MTPATHITGGARRSPGSSLTQKRRASRAQRAPSADTVLELVRRHLARHLHVHASGLARSHARTDRLAAEMRYGRIRSLRQTLRLGLSAAPMGLVQSRLAALGSPRVFEGAWHAQLRLVAASIARLLAPTGAVVSFEDATGDGHRIDLLLRGATGTPLLGIECGVTAGDTVYAHLAAGIPRVLVMPFDHATWAMGAVSAWSFVRSGEPPLLLPQSDAIRAAYAALGSPDITVELVRSQTQS